MRIVTIQQPNYFPWLGYFEQLRVSDEFLLLDDVQWIKQGRQHRCVIQNENRCWLSLPVKSNSHREKTIKDMRAASDLPWANQHWNLLQSCYGDSPYFSTQLKPLLLPWYQKMQKQEFLFDILHSGLALISEALQLPSDFPRSSDFAVQSKKSQRLVDLCNELQADTYYSSLGSTRYLDLSCFRASEIRVITQHWNPPFNLGDLSILHALAHHSLAELKHALEPKPWGPFASRLTSQPDPRLYTNHDYSSPASTSMEFAEHEPLLREARNLPANGKD